MHKRLFIPGPTEVRSDVLEILKRPMIAHRHKDFSDLYARIQPKLQTLLCTKNPVIICTSSSTGAMEGAVRNCVKKRVLSLINGAFAERWYEIALLNGREADPVQIEWGKAVKPEHIDKALASGKYDAMMMVHNETSTGVLSHLEPIAQVMKKYPDVLWLVDAVSSMAGMRIPVDELGIDVCLAGVQKCFGLPPGLTVFSMSEKALNRSKQIKDKGYYFNFEEFIAWHAKNQTPTTPCITLMYGLEVQLERFFKEGLENRYARHRRMAERCRQWARERFELFPEPGYESLTLTTIRNTRSIDVKKLNEELGKRGAVIADGYGKIKDITFRIAHMGDTTPDELNELLQWIDEIIVKM